MITNGKLSSTRHQTYLPLLLAISTIAALIGALHLLNVDAQTHLLIEGGPIQSLTVVGYAACIACIALLWSWPTIQTRWTLMAIMGLFIFIELDLDKSLFTVGLLKSRQYIGDQVALPERALSFVLIGLIAAVVISILIRETRSFLSGVIRRSPSELATLSGIALIFVSEAADGLGRKLAGLGIAISQSTAQSSYIVEEVVELGIPILFAAAIATSRAATAGKPAYRSLTTPGQRTNPATQTHH